MCFSLFLYYLSQLYQDADIIYNDVVFDLKFMKNKISRKLSNFLKMNYPDTEKDICKKLSVNNTKILVISLYLSFPESSHAAAVVINKYLKTIEFYDPSYQGHPEYEIIFDFFKNIPCLKTYKFVCQDILGIQHHEQKIRDVFWLGGFCQIFTLMIIHYRILYPKISPNKFINLFLIKIFGYEKYIKNPDAFTKLKTMTLVLNYLKYINKKTVELVIENENLYESIFRKTFKIDIDEKNIEILRQLFILLVEPFGRKYKKTILS